MSEERDVYRVLVGKPEGRRPLGRPRRRWVVNIRMDLQEFLSQTVHEMATYRCDVTRGCVMQF